MTRDRTKRKRTDKQERKGAGKYVLEYLHVTSNHGNWQQLSRSVCVCAKAMYSKTEHHFIMVVYQTVAEWLGVWCQKVDPVALLVAMQSDEDFSPRMARG